MLTNTKKIVVAAMLVAAAFLTKPVAAQPSGGTCSSEMSECRAYGGGGSIDDLYCGNDEQWHGHFECWYFPDVFLWESECTAGSCMIGG